MPIDSSTENMYIKGLWQKKTGKCGNVSQVGTLPTPPKKVKKKESGNGVDQPTNPYFDQIHTFSRLFLSVNGIGDIGDIMLGRKGSNYYCC